MNPYQIIVEQLVVDASFLWWLRTLAFDQPHYELGDIQELELRIDRNIEALFSYDIDNVWAVCKQQLLAMEPGEAFVSALIAFRINDESKIQHVVDLSCTDVFMFKGVVSAIAWLPGRYVHHWIKRFASSKDLQHKYLALAASSARREDMGESLDHLLTRGDCLAHKNVHCRALRAIGEFKRFDLKPILFQSLASEDVDAAFWANWSLVLLGDYEQIDNMKTFVFCPGPHQRRALELAFCTLPLERAKQWISRLAKDKDQARNVIKASAILGDPQAIPWLISMMQDPKNAKLAAEAFSTITGIDLERHQLTAPPDPSVAKEDEKVLLSVDEDENLSIPEPAAIADIWRQRSQHFSQGQRYFLGKTITKAHLEWSLRHGLSRQRRRAALEYAVIEPSVFLPNIQFKVSAYMANSGAFADA